MAISRGSMSPSHVGGASLLDQAAELLEQLTGLPWELRSTCRVVTPIKRQPDTTSDVAVAFYKRFDALPELTPHNVSAFIVGKHPELQGIDLSSLFYFSYDKACITSNEIIYADYLMFFVKPDTVKALHDLYVGRRQ